MPHDHHHVRTADGGLFDGGSVTPVEVEESFVVGAEENGLQIMDASADTREKRIEYTKQHRTFASVHPSIWH